MTARHAAVTIASKNYLAYATTLAESYLRFHPDHDFIVALVDKADGVVSARLDCGAEVIEIANFAIPDLGRFIYRYTIMELNTAVKPFVMDELLQRRGYETLVYLDPDIQVFGPLASVQRALTEASIALTPHMRRPYEDDALPSDLTILQSGTYNLGFLGLRGGETAKRMLAWWSGKLYRDCVVDIPKGLFVDQKWIDLVPGFFPDHRIVHDPGCNAAYWNLHERPLSREQGRWHVGGEPLAFFHFSGYVPFVPGSLSKHQDRHDLRHMPLLRELVDGYAAALMGHGYEATSAHPYAFATLANGVRLPMDLVRHAMQWAARANVSTPCPVSAPDAFCRWLMSRNVLPHRPQVSTVLNFLLEHRGDVRNAYPNAMHDSRDPGFHEWLRNSGVKEYAIADLLAYEEPDAADDAVADAFHRLRAARRDEIFARFADLWDDPAAFQAFADWMVSPAARALRLDRRHADALRRALPGVARIVNLYFLRGDLQQRFAFPGDEFAGWLRENRYALGLEPAEISLYQEFARARSARIEQMRLLYAHRAIPGKSPLSPFAVEERLREIASPIDPAGAVRILASLAVEAADHVDDVARLDQFEREGRALPGLDARAAFELSRRMREGLAARRAGPARVNTAGYFNAPSGMGESARSMRATLAHANVRPAFVTLPHPLAQSSVLARDPAFFGWPVAGADVSITVANADAADVAAAFLPAHFGGRRNVAYWVWETQAMPERFAESARGFDEIWTPSRHSARAIEQAVRVPVKVLSHVLDFGELDAARADRRRFGLPAEGTLFGFAFDPLSVLERKNVAGLMRAFRDAFRDDDDCWLVLKVNGRPASAYEYERARANAGSPRILFVEGTLDRRDSHAFMRSLDAYASLHRAEGFGLTCAEAMGMGLPVVATGYSGNLDFMDDSNSLLVPARVIETDRPYGPYPAGTRWGDPDHDAAVQMLRSLMERTRREELGERGRAAVRERLDPRKVGARAAELLQALVAR